MKFINIFIFISTLVICSLTATQITIKLLFLQLPLHKTHIITGRIKHITIY